MNINFELYRVFYAVANHGNITKAAHELFISQPAISKSIKHLEEQLGGALFIRTKRGVILTEAGQKLYDNIKIALDQINNAEHQFTDNINLRTGKLKIGVSTTIAREYLLPYLEVFHKNHPGIDIKINTDLAYDSLERLKSGLLDIVFVTLPMIIPNNVELINCKEIHDCFVANEAYTELKNKTIPMSDLSQYPLILQSDESNIRTFLNDFCSKQGITLKPNMELSSYSLVVDFVKMGLGIGMATREYIQDDLKSNQLFELSINPKIPTRYIAMALLKNSDPSFATKKLMEIIVGGTHE